MVILIEGFIKFRENVSRIVKKVNNALGGVTKAYEKVLYQTTKWDAKKKKFIPVMKKFRMEMLSIMFAGMQLSKTFGKIVTPVLEMTGATDILTFALQEMVFTAIEPFSEAIISLSEWLMELPEPVKVAIGTFMILGKVLGDVLFFIGSMILGLGGLGTAGMTAMMAFPGFAAIITLIAKTLGVTSDQFAIMIGTLGGGIATVLTFTKTLGDIWAVAKDWLGKKVKTTLTFINDFGTKVWDVIKKMGTTIWETGKATFKATVSFLESAWSTIWDAVKKLGTVLWSAGKATYEATVSFLEKGWSAIINAITLAFPGFSAGGAVLTITVSFFVSFAVVRLIRDQVIDIFTRGWGRVGTALAAALLTGLGTALGIIGAALIATIFGAPIGVPLVVAGGIMGALGAAMAIALQKGGIVTKPTLAMVGERGPEAVIPLKQMPTIYFSPTINISATISTEIDIREIGRVLVDQMRSDLMRRM